MKAVHVIILILLAVSAYLVYTQGSVKKTIVVPEEAVASVKTAAEEVPATWNLDWDGGPGYDRYRIMNEKGPWNPNGT